MKELSIEEKAKRYDEVVAIAKECITHIPDEAVNKYMLNMFPELKESDGERIRKQIISFLKEFEHDHYRSLDFSSWIAWLEKQGNEKDIHLLELKAQAYDDTKERMSYAYNQNRVPIGFISEIFPNLNSYEKQSEQKTC